MSVLRPARPRSSASPERAVGRRSRRPVHVVRVAALASALSLSIAGPAQAIVSGEPGNGGHDAVGAIVLDYGYVLLPICTGVLIAPDVFLTASHCGEDSTRVSVTIGPTVETAALHEGTFYRHPQFRREYDPYDVAVVVLDDEVSGPTPEALPAAGYLNGKNLRGATFTTVGYGYTRLDPVRKAGRTFQFDFVQRIATGTFLALEPARLLISENPVRGDGGSCAGDSGGPHYESTTGKLVSITLTGDWNCRASDLTLRLDRTPILSFLGAFL